MNEHTTIDSEKYILAILLKVPDYLYEFGDRLHVDIFSSYPHKVLLKVTKDLLREGLHPEIHLMVEHLKNQEKLEEVGGTEYLEMLFGLDVSPENLGRYIEIVEDAYLKRFLFSMSAEIPSKITSGESPKQILSSLNNRLAGIALTGQDKQKTKAVGDLVEAYKERLKKRIQNPGIPGKSFGYKSLDYHLGGAEGGELVIVGGRPGVGKTRFAINSLARNGEKSLMFSREMSWERLFDVLVSLLSGVQSKDLLFGTISKEQAVKVKGAMEYLEEERGKSIWIDEHFFSDLDYIMAVIRKFKYQHDISFVYIDYLQLIAERNTDAVNEIGRITRALKLLAEELGITIILLSQLNRGSEHRENTRPVISDLRQSGNIEEDADIIILLHRNKDEQGIMENTLEVIIGKGRHTGQGAVKMDFRGEVGLIEDRSVL